MEQIHIFGPAARWLSHRSGPAPEQVDIVCDEPLSERNSFVTYLHTLGFGNINIADVLVWEETRDGLRIPFDGPGVEPYSVANTADGWRRVPPTVEVAQTVNLANLTTRIECGENMDDIIATIVACGGVDITARGQTQRRSGYGSMHHTGEHDSFGLYEGTDWSCVKDMAHLPSFRRLLAGLNSRGQQTMARQLAVVAEVAGDDLWSNRETQVSMNIDGTWTTCADGPHSAIFTGAGGEQVGCWAPVVADAQVASGYGSTGLAAQLGDEDLWLHMHNAAVGAYALEGDDAHETFSLFEQLNTNLEQRAILFDDEKYASVGPNSLVRAVAQNPRAALHADWDWLAEKLGTNTVEKLLNTAPDVAINVNSGAALGSWSDTIFPHGLDGSAAVNLAVLSGLSNASATWAANAPESFAAACSTPLNTLGAGSPTDAGLVLCPQTYAASCPVEFGQSLLKQPAEQRMGEYGYDEASPKYPGAEYALEHFPQLAAQVAGEQFGEFLRHRLAQSSMLTRAFGRGGDKRLLEICQNPNRADVGTLAVYAQTLVKLERCVDEYANLLTDPLSDPVGVALCTPGSADWEMTEQLMAQVVQHPMMGGSLSAPADAKNVGGLDVTTLAQNVDALVTHMLDARERAQVRMFGSGEAALRYHAIVTGAESEGETMHAQYLQILTTTAAVRQTLLDAQVSHTHNMELVAVGKTMSALANRAENVYIQIRGEDGDVDPEAILPAVREQWAKLVKTFSAETSAFVTTSSAGQRHTNMRKIGVGLGVATTVAELDCGRAAAVGR